jgi:DNA-binding GntR family transcriptional regulator
VHVRHGQIAGAAPPPAGDRDDTPAARRFAHLHRELRTRIVRHRYPPGHRLDLDALAAEFRVSRTPLRSVFQRLAYEGLVVSRHGVPTTVTEVDTAGLRESLAFRMRLAELIGDLSPRAPGSATVRRLAAARDAAAALAGSPGDVDAFVGIDLELHEAVCDLIGNAPLLLAYDQAYYRTARMWWLFLPELDWSREVAVFARELELQVEAAARGDVRAVGFNTRNALSALLHRLDGLMGA